MSIIYKFQEIGGRIAAQRHMSAIKDGIIISLPVTLAGSLFLIIRFFPIPNWDTFMQTIFGANWSLVLSYPIAATFDLIGVIACIGISYRLSESYKVDPLLGSIISLCGYFTIVPSFFIQNIEGTTKMLEITNVWRFQYTGAASLFVVLITSIFSTEIYRTIIQKGFVIKLPDMVPPNVSKSFLAVVPAFTVLCTMWIIRLLLASTPFETLHNLINTIITRPITSLGSTLPGYAILIFLKDLFWSLGIHGSNALSPIFQPLEATFRDANRIAAQMGEQLPYVISGQLWREIFTQIGGGGNTLPLVVMCAFFAKSEKIKSIGKLSLAPGIFGINEPIIFGLPIVLNPIMIIPFILSPLAGVLIAYTATSIGLVAKMPGIDIPWTTPPIINAYLSSGGKISVVICQIAIIGISGLIYFPFFKIMDKQALREEQEQIIEK